MNLNHPARPIPPPRPVDPAGAVDHAQIAWPTAPWTALTTRRPQDPQALLPPIAQERLLKEGRTTTTEGGNINVLTGGKLGVLLTPGRRSVAHPQETRRPRQDRPTRRRPARTPAALRRPRLGPHPLHRGRGPARPLPRPRGRRHHPDGRQAQAHVLPPPARPQLHRQGQLERRPPALPLQGRLPHPRPADRLPGVPARRRRAGRAPQAPRGRTRRSCSGLAACPRRPRPPGPARRPGHRRHHRGH